MMCKCGGVFRLINIKNLIDEVEKEYLCSSCNAKMKVWKDTKDNFRMEVDGVQKKIDRPSSSGMHFWGDSKKVYICGTGYSMVAEID